MLTTLVCVQFADKNATHREVNFYSKIRYIHSDREDSGFYKKLSFSSEYRSACIVTIYEGGKANVTAPHSTRRIIYMRSHKADRKELQNESDGASEPVLGFPSEVQTKG